MEGPILATVLEGLAVRIEQGTELPEALANEVENLVSGPERECLERALEQLRNSPGTPFLDLLRTWPGGIPRSARMSIGLGHGSGMYPIGLREAAGTIREQAAKDLAAGGVARPLRSSPWKYWGSILGFLALDVFLFGGWFLYGKGDWSALSACVVFGPICQVAMLFVMRKVQQDPVTGDLTVAVLWWKSVIRRKDILEVPEADPAGKGLLFPPIRYMKNGKESSFIMIA